MMSEWNSDEDVHKYFANEMKNWKFNPPFTPHFGDVWEANIKQIKNRLKTVDEQISTYGEFLTLTAQIEKCLNSRPLMPIFSDPDDLTALTLGHFLIGAPLYSLPEPGVSSIYTTPLQRWKLLQKIFQSFWKRWSSDYLSLLQYRSKWMKSTANLKLNDLVLIKEKNHPPLR